MTSGNFFMKVSRTQFIKTNIAKKKLLVYLIIIYLIHLRQCGGRRPLNLVKLLGLWPSSGSFRGTIKHTNRNFVSLYEHDYSNQGGRQDQPFPNTLIRLTLSLPGCRVNSPSWGGGDSACNGFRDLGAS